MWKGKYCLAFAFQQVVSEAVGTPVSEVALPSSFPRNYTKHLSIKLPFEVSVSIGALSRFILRIP